MIDWTKEELALKLNSANNMTDELIDNNKRLLAENKALREELIQEKTYFCDQVCTRKHLCDECDDKKRIEELKGGEK
jgi:hypothetical protein